jgi:hypothetical protein
MRNTEQKCTGQQTLAPTASSGIVVKTRLKAGAWNNGD